MKKKINRYLVLTVFAAIVATLIIAVAIFRNMYKNQVLSEMRTYAALINSLTTSTEELTSQYTEDVAGLRVTLIDEDGSVLYDSDVDGALENHADRKEVQEAKSDGEGWTTRYSDSLDSELYYYAVKRDDGSILRISKEEASIWGIFTGTLTGIFIVAAVMFLACMFLARTITASIVHPIEQMAANIDSVSADGIYEELVPFVMTIRAQHEDILKSAKMRQEFTANVSHELKTPLTSISGYAELIETGIAGEKEVQHFAHEIHRGAQRLLTMINDIIRLSELDSEKMSLAASKVDLYAVASACVESVRLNAQKNHISIKCTGSPCTVCGDKNMLEELIYNLCDNAIRYNKPHGSVDVIVEEQADRVILQVKDTGIGIPEESQERVFERFYCVDKSRSKNTGGTGLGLAIVKHIVAQHNARIELKSQVGAGTEITVTFEKPQTGKL
ncbi:MAG: two-component sensor histidine kinase [Clostridiales bacterium]|nr:two-component sensor histidine kinase [Clostridiales bacterium]